MPLIGRSPRYESLLGRSSGSEPYGMGPDWCANQTVDMFCMCRVVLCDENLSLSKALSTSGKQGGFTNLHCVLLKVCPLLSCSRYVSPAGKVSVIVLYRR